MYIIHCRGKRKKNTSSKNLKTGLRQANEQEYNKVLVAIELLLRANSNVIENLYSGLFLNLGNVLMSTFMRMTTNRLTNVSYR